MNITKEQTETVCSDLDSQHTPIHLFKKGDTYHVVNNCKVCIFTRINQDFEDYNEAYARYIYLKWNGSVCGFCKAVMTTIKKRNHG